MFVPNAFCLSRDRFGTGDVLRTFWKNEKRFNAASVVSKCPGLATHSALRQRLRQRGPTRHAGVVLKRGKRGKGGGGKVEGFHGGFHGGCV